MNTWKVKKNAGFSLIELMIVIVIVAILVSLAYPSYIQYVRKSKRGEAQQLLMNWSINQEIWRSNNTQYASEGDLAVPINDNYQFSTIGGAPDATTYTLQAAAQDDQANDVSRDGDPCEFLTLDQSGVKGVEPACWD
ncbi:MAG: prepilin-type N-terminal cleavage/methylation domain-containing protein [Proteobacteria bacterium]|nr:prepilin-type N-terminal cleavage/methylation domain-containing protein [Pseudomonadota bacterium]